MKIVVNGLSARLGGGQTYLRNLLGYIPDRDDLSIMVFAPENLELPEHPCVRRIRPNWPAENPLLRTLWETLILPRFLKREGAQVLFCPGGVISTPVSAGVRVVTMFRNMIPFDPGTRRSIPPGLQRMRNWVLYHLMLRSLAHADLTIFISEHVRGVIEALAPVRNPVTIAHGINEMFRTHDRRPARPACVAAGEYLLYVSRFDVYKHHDQVVLAYAGLPGALRERFTLVLAGETNLPETARVKKSIAQLGLTEQVVLLGAIPYSELPALYHHAKLVLFASSCENCPNILLEALGSGRPVLCSDVMPMPEFGADAVAYFSPFDPRSILTALEAVLTDEAYAARLAAAAVQRSAHFDWAETVRKTWDCIFKLIDDPPAR